MKAIVRPASEADVEAIRDIYAPLVRETAISFETEVPDRDEISRRIRDTQAKLPWLTCDRGGAVFGYAYASPYRARAAYRWSVEVSVYVHKDARRQGVGRRLYAALLELLIEQGYCTAYAGITLPNAASVELHEAMGFEAVGVFRRAGFKQGRFWDVGWWQRWLRDDSEPLANVMSFETLRSRVDWTRW